MTGGFKGSMAGFWVVTDRATNSVLASLRVVGQTESSILYSWTGTGHTDNSELNTLGGSGPADRSKLGALTETGLVDLSVSDIKQTIHTRTHKLKLNSQIAQNQAHCRRLDRPTVY